jgi:hypothetical protein
LLSHRFAFIVSIMTVVLIFSSSAAMAATTVYLRPNADTSVLGGGWTVLGGSRGWEVLDEALTEAQTPAAGDEIAASGSAKTIRIDFGSISRAGTKFLEGRAWYFTPAGRVSAVAAAESIATPAVKTTTAGWHSIPLTSEQLETQGFLNDLHLRFTNYDSTSTASVSVALIRLSVELPSPSIYWGARMDGDVALMEQPPSQVRGDAPWTAETWNLFESHAGKQASIVHFGQPSPWLQKFEPGPFELTRARGAVPMVSIGSGETPFSELEEGGAKEGALRNWAKEVATEYSKPFFLRWDWEMNLISAPDIPWASIARSSPGAFVRAWRNFRRIADEEGATNITWVWCPNVSYPGSTSLASLYPGNAYVDWLCMDGYNRGTNPLQPDIWKSFGQIFQGSYDELTSSDFPGNQKPLMIGETASTEVGGSKSEWIDEALSQEVPSFKRIKALVWFNWNILKGSSRWDWPIESSVNATKAFAIDVSSPLYATNTFSNLPSGSRVQALP